MPAPIGYEQVMFGPLAMLAVTVSAAASTGAPVAERPSSYPPRTGATARATASVRIISGVRFGSAQLSGAPGAHRRKAQLTEADGIVSPAELLEFQ